MATTVDDGRSPADAGSGCQPAASAADASSRSGIPNADDDPWLWYWGYGAEPERYYGGEETREAILQVANLESDGETFSIVEAKRGGFNFDIFDADRVLEDFDEHNEECWGEDGPDYKCPAGSKRFLERMLASAFEAWFAEYKPTHRFSFEFMRNEQTFPSSEDLEQVQA